MTEKKIGATSPWFSQGILGKSLIGGIILTVTVFTGKVHADEGWLQFPAIYPSKACSDHTFKIPEGLPRYNVLKNRDCSIFYILPPTRIATPTILQQNHNISRCGDLDRAQNSLNKLYEAQDIIAGKWAELEDSDLSEVEKALELDGIENRLSRVSKAIDDSNERIARTFGGLQGATMQVFISTDIPDQHLAAIKAANPIPRYNPETDRLEYLVPQVEKARMSNGVVSFKFHSKTNLSELPTVLSTTIPGLEVLQQEGASQDVAHVKVGEGEVSGEISLSLKGICNAVEQDDDGRYFVNRNRFVQTMAINQYAEVEMSSRYGYTASLKVEDFVEKVLSGQIIKGKGNFETQSLLEQTEIVDINKAMSFEWTEELTDDDLDPVSKTEIKKEAFANLTHQLIEKLEQSELITLKAVQEFEPVEGGQLSVDRVGQRCWSKRKLLRSRKTTCQNYVFAVKEWRDGVSETEAFDGLKREYNLTDSMEVNQVVPHLFNFTFYDSEENFNQSSSPTQKISILGKEN